MSLSFEFSESIQSVWSDWERMSDKDVFLGLGFHRAIENSPPSGIRPFYCTIKEGKRLIGICYFQLKYLRLSESLRVSDGKKLTDSVKRCMVNRINIHSLVCGNTMVTGQYGFRFLSEYDHQQKFDLVKSATNELIQKLNKEENIKVKCVLFKDYFPHQLPEEKIQSYTKFKVQPSMIFNVDPEWKDTNDYTNAMKKKYRTRFKRARKKKGEIETRELSVSDIERHLDRINELYRYVSDQANFNLFVLDQKYFLELKKHLQDDIIINGYFLNEKLVGFYTTILNQSNLDAHFLGYDKDINKEAQLYLNMLYDMVEIGIQRQVNKIFMSRTALEIKSSVGAKDFEMFCCINYQDKWINNLIPSILNNLVPDHSWVPRNPFN